MSPVDFKWQRNEPRVVQTIIYVEPVAKGRPRSTVIAGHVHSYTPAKTRNAEAMIQAMIRTKARELGRFDAGVPIRLEATFYRERPKHLPKRVTMPVSRPDYDNYAKLLTDALEKFVYANDSQITTALVRKRFVDVGGPPRIELKLEVDEQ